MKERSDPPSLEKLGEEIERFREREHLEDPEGIDIPIQVPSGAGAGLEFFSSVVAGAGLGFFLDQWLGLTPILMVTGLFFGAAAGFYALYRSAKPANAQNSAKSEPTNVK